MMNRFLSEESINAHKEHLKNMKLKYSVMEISYPEIKGKSIKNLRKLKLGSDKENILKLKCDICLHDVFFSSFNARNEASHIIRRQYRTEASFLYELYEYAKEKKDFLIVYYDGKRVKFSGGDGVYEIMCCFEPILALDLCEHTYFSDYGFNKNSYLENALYYLNLKKIDEKYSAGIEK